MTALVVALDAVARESVELDARSEAEAVAQPLYLADTTFDRAAQRVRLAARYHGVLRFDDEPLTHHHTCTGKHRHCHVPTEIRLGQG